MAVFSAIPLVKIRESYPMTGEPRQYKRRDMRRGAILPQWLQLLHYGSVAVQCLKFIAAMTRAVGARWLRNAAAIAAAGDCIAASIQRCCKAVTQAICLHDSIERCPPYIIRAAKLDGRAWRICQVGRCSFTGSPHCNDEGKQTISHPMFAPKRRICVCAGKHQARVEVLPGGALRLHVAWPDPYGGSGSDTFTSPIDGGCSSLQHF